ncbi:MAG TPA: peptidylprolyl isomerase [Actinobacteria bacterium]|nr:peptidylprolyl isomerase [Actinomycetota bacterium]
MPVKKGDTVFVHYSGKLEDGMEFDSSEGRDPLAFEVGSGQVVLGFDEAVIGMEEGEKKDVTISPENGYGEYKQELMKDFSRSMLGTNQVTEGQTVQLQTPDDQVVSATVYKLSDDVVTFDFNHPLAGKTLCFEIELVGIK